MNMHSPVSANRASSFQAALSAAAAWAPLAPIANDWIAFDLGVPGDQDLTEEDADRHDEFLRAVLAMEAPSIETALAKQRLYLAMNGTPAASSLYAPLAIDPLVTLIADLEKLVAPPQRPSETNPASKPCWAVALKTMQDLEEADEDGDQATDQRAEAEVALIRTPAPDALAVAEKVRRMALTMEPGSHNFDAAMADAWLQGPAEWEQRCAGAIYLDLLRLGSAPSPAGDPSAAAVWQAARQAFLAAQARHEALGDFDTVEAEEAFTAQLAAEMIYAQTPTPNVEALATMLRDVLNFDGFPDADDRADKRESIQKLLNDDEPGMNYLGMAYQHATRLVSDVGEIHEARRGIPTQRGPTDEEFNARVAAQSAAA